MNTALGIDIGGSGIKGALVDCDSGVLLTKRHRIETPHPATPDAVALATRAVMDHFSMTEEIPIGVTLPAVVRNGVVRTAANIDPTWIGTHGVDLFRRPWGGARHYSMMLMLQDWQRWL